MDNPILYIVIAAIAGIVLGKLDTVFTGSLKKSREAKKEQALQQDIEQLKQELERAKQQPAAPRPENKPALQIALTESGEWVVEIDGAPVQPGTINADQRARLIGVLGQVRPLVEAKPVASQAVQPAPAPASAGQSAPLSAPQASSPNLPPSPLRASLVGGLRSTINKPEPAPSPLSVVALIDDILQKQIAGTPLASRQIRLEEGTTGEVLVHVGTTRYAGIDSVPDPEIQAAIHKAINEFNK